MLQLLSPQSRWACWCVGVLVWVGLSLPVQAQEKRLLFFGNSFSLGGGGIHLNVHDLAVASGHDAPVVVGDLASGQDIDYHIGQVNNLPGNNVNHAALGAGETWDAIVVQGYSTEDWHPEEALSRVQALALFTSAPAYAAFMEDDLGTIEVGKLADFSVFDRDLMTIPEAEILEAETVMTVVHGEIVYQAD